MGRQLKRVPLDFSWPLDKAWGGYRNPFYNQSVDCSDCGGTGSSKEARHLTDQWYGNAPFRPEDRGSIPFTITDIPVRRFAERNVAGSPEYYGTGEAAIVREATRLCSLFNKRWMHHINDDDVAALVEATRLMDFTHTCMKDVGWQKNNPLRIPTAKDVNDWSIEGFGHDSINCWVVVKAECKRCGYETTCYACQGEGQLWPAPEIKKMCDDWMPIEPPEGEGYQLWETVSEGSPISPVFTTPEELAQWLVANDSSITKGTTYDQWLKFINGPGWALSGVIENGVCKTGVNAI